MKDSGDKNDPGPYKPIRRSPSYEEEIPWEFTRIWEEDDEGLNYENYIKAYERSKKKTKLLSRKKYDELMARYYKLMEKGRHKGFSTQMKIEIEDIISQCLLSGVD